jgi:hypothetical protein
MKRMETAVSAARKIAPEDLAPPDTLIPLDEAARRSQAFFRRAD